MLKIALGFLIVAMPVGGLQAQTMPVSTFLAKAESLKKKGPLALLSSDLGVVKKEVKNSSLALRQERLAAKSAGRKPAFCPPEKGAQVSSEEALAYFRSIPIAEQRRMPVRDAMRSFMARKYPCPA